MSRPRQRCAVFLGLLLSFAAARGQLTAPDAAGVRSVSGQFLVTTLADDAPAYRSRSLAANTNLVHLEPAFLAVAAERFKLSLWQQLGLPPDTSWSGKIFLAVRPAHATNEFVAIASSPFLKHWNYRVEFPDVLARTRYARAFSAVLLLELANRGAGPGHSAEVPAWLVDGLAQQVLAADGDKVLLTPPVQKRDGSPVSRMESNVKDFDALADARPILQNVPALSFDELSWPSDAQMDGADGGRYQASAQLFVSELLALKNGREKMRALLGELPAHLNWQTAFFNAFRDDFKRPLDVEKWWALRVIHFSAQSPGPRWTTEISHVRLEQILRVPVDFRSDSNALPAHAEISLQAALKNLPPSQRDEVMRRKLRDLTLVELRLAPPFGQLADGYRLALAGFLGELKKPATVTIVNRHASTAPERTSVAATGKKLDALDLRRRDAVARSVVPLPGTSPSAAR